MGARPHTLGTQGRPSKEGGRQGECTSTPPPPPVCPAATAPCNGARSFHSVRSVDGALLVAAAAGRWMAHAAAPAAVVPLCRCGGMQVDQRGDLHPQRAAHDARHCQLDAHKDKVRAHKVCHGAGEGSSGHGRPMLHGRVPCDAGGWRANCRAGGAVQCTSQFAATFLPCCLEAGPVPMRAAREAPRPRAKALISHQ